MKEPIFTGAAVAIITPMNEDGTVNYDEFAKLVDWQLENGTDAIVICGTTGESSTLEVDEHIECIRWCINYVNGRCKVIAGTGSNSTASAIEMSKEACEDGADALLLVTPYYNKTSQRGLIAHYKAIHDATDKPIILYNVPSRTGVNILPETAAYLYNHVENIVGIKEATGNVAQAAKTLHLTDGKIDMYSGEDGIVVPLLALGAIGVISVWSNVAPKQGHDMCMRCFEGGIAGAAKMQLEAEPLIDALFSEVNPIPVKKALNLMGMEVGPLRAPLYEMEEEHAKKLAEAMRAYGLPLA